MLNLLGNRRIAAADLENLTATLSDEVRPGALENTLRLFAGAIPVYTGTRSRQSLRNISRTRSGSRPIHPKPTIQTQRYARPARWMAFARAVTLPPVSRSISR